MNAVSPRTADRVVVVGGGVAGLSVALRLAPRPVTLVTASALGLGTATGWAQGGIAAAVGSDDAPRCMPPIPTTTICKMSMLLF